MYSRATPFEKSDELIGTHQKIDRAARLILREIMKDKHKEKSLDEFPKINQILHFEGKNGPDGIKMKSPGKDEPWHFADPHGDMTQMKTYVENHIYNLAQALERQDQVRASFEAAWLAHAVTDALTPAHQYPMEDKIIELTGKPPSARSKLSQKMFLPADTWREGAKINWEYIGPKGVMTTHMLYELGVAVLISPIAPRSLAKKPHKNDLERVLDGHFMELLEEKINYVADCRYYQRFTSSGWTNRLTLETADELLPQISQVVALAWLAGIEEFKK